MTETLSTAEAGAYLDGLASDFSFFLAELWRNTGLDRKHPLGELELDVADYVQNGPPKRGVLAFRFFGKSTIITCAYAAWRLFSDPQTKIVVVSKSDGHAKKLIKLVREWIDTVWFLNHLNPETGDDRPDRTDYFDVGPAKKGDTHAHSLQAFGIGGQLTGARGDLLIADDIETLQNTLTVDARDRLSDQVAEFHHVAQFGRKEIIYIGTPHHEETLYTKLAKRGYAFRSYPKVYPQPKELVLGLAPILQARLDSGAVQPGDITAPYRVTQDEIASDQREGVTNFGMQCGLVCNLGQVAQYPIRLRDLIVFDCPHPRTARKAPISLVYGTQTRNGQSTAIQDIPCLGFAGDALHRPAYIDEIWEPYTATKAAIDPAGKGSDRLGLAIGSHLNANIFLHLLQGLTGGASLENMDYLARTLRAHDAREVLVETNIDTMGVFVQLLEAAIRRYLVKPGGTDDEGNSYPAGWAASITPIHSTGQKELRLCMTLEPVIAAHQLIVSPATVTPLDPSTHPEEREIDHAQYQLTRLRRIPNCLAEDGKLDALQILIHGFKHTLHADPGQRAAKARERRTQDTIDQWKSWGLESEPQNQPRFFEHR